MKKNKKNGKSLNEAEVGKAAGGFEFKGGKNEEGGYDVEVHLSKEEYEGLKNKKIPSGFPGTEMLGKVPMHGGFGHNRKRKGANNTSLNPNDKNS